MGIINISTLWDRNLGHRGLNSLRGGATASKCPYECRTFALHHSLHVLEEITLINFFLNRVTREFQETEAHKVNRGNQAFQA